MSRNWYLQHDGNHVGPLTSTQLKHLAETSQISRQSLIRSGKTGNWTSADHVKGLFSDDLSGSLNQPPPLPDPEQEVESTDQEDGPQLADLTDHETRDGLIDPVQLGRQGGFDTEGASFNEEIDDVFPSVGHPAPFLHQQPAGRFDPSTQNAATRIPIASIPAKFREFIQQDETVLYASNPSKNARMLNMILAGAGSGVFFLVPILGFLAASEIAAAVLLLVVGFIVVSLLTYIAHLNWKNRYYMITNTRTIVSQGIFNIAVKIVFNHNIQMISINTGIIDRWLDLNSIQLSTSGAGGGLPIFGSFPGMSPGNVQLRWVANAPSVVGLIAS